MMGEEDGRPMRGRMRRRVFLTLAGKTVVGTILGGYAAGGSAWGAPAPPPGFKLINFFTTEDDPATQAVVTDAAQAFSKQHPGVAITQILISNADRDQRVLAGLSVGQNLDLFEIGAPYRGAFIEANYLHPLDSLIKDVGEEQFAPGTRIIVNGHDYVFPYGGGPVSLWYRKDRVPEAPRTFEDLKSAAAAAASGGNYGVALAVGGFGPVDYIFPPMVWAQGADYFDPQGRVLFGSEKATQAIQNFVDLLKSAPPDNTNWTFYSLIQAYLSGRTAISFYPGRLGFNIPSKAPQLEDITAVEPTVFGPVPVHQWRWSSLAIDRKAKEPELIMEFVKFLLTGKHGVAYANSVPGQLIPSVRSVREAAVNATDNPYVAKHKDWLQVLNGQITSSLDISGPMGAMASGTLKLYNGLPAPWAATAWGIHPVDMQMIQKIVLQKWSIKDAQKWATDQYTAIVNDYKTKHPNWKPYHG